VKRLTALLLVVPLTAACGSDGGHSRPTLPRSLERLYAYDRGAPLGLRDHGIVNPTYPVKVHDVDYLSARGGRVPGFLVVPPGNGAFAGVIFMHGSGGTRWEFLLPAVRLAQRGAVALTITGPFERSPQPLQRQPRELHRDRDRFVHEVTDLRRAVDVLVARRDVDPDRIGFVGFSAGAEAGAVLAAVEPRVRAFDLISGGGSLNFIPPLSARLQKREARVIDSFRPSRIVRYAEAPLFLQLGRYDAEIGRGRQLELLRAAPEPKKVRWYPAGHDLGPDAQRDSFAWLGQELSLKARG
jgi:dienelactone hydrolase